MFLLDSTKAAAAWDETVKHVHDILMKNHSEIVASRQWDERRLAYTGDDHKKGTYLLTYFRTDRSNLKEIVADCELSDVIVRELILKVHPKLADHLVNQAMTSTPDVDTEAEGDVEFDERRRRDEVLKGLVPVPITGASREEENKRSQAKESGERVSGSSNRTGFYRDGQIEIGGALYPLRLPINGAFESSEVGVVEFKAQDCGSLFVGKGSIKEEAYQDWCDQIHSAFQALCRKQEFELSEEEAQEWAVLSQLIDVPIYQDRLPVVLNETGRISGMRPGMRTVTWWPSEERETIAFDQMPVDFAGYGLNQWFEAVVERNRRTWEFQKGRHVQTIDPIVPMDDDEVTAFLAGARTLADLPEAQDDEDEP